MAFTEVRKRIHSASVIGFGSGRTVWRLLGSADKMGEGKLCVAASDRTARLAHYAGFTVMGIGEVPVVDLAIDGADEFTVDGALAKGGGGALVAEREILHHAHETMIVAAEHRLVDYLSQTAPIIAEVTPGRGGEAIADLASLPLTAELRAEDESQFVTEAGNQVIQLTLNPAADLDAVAAQIDCITAIVAHGIFLNHIDAIARFSSETPVARSTFNAQH